ncbi:MAG: hypothetical protein GX181_01130 [Synergistaceae bacterium]|nr:histidine kinase [Synergistota bacterium]NLM70548.1 hypothetical protein [Synergistaceae bacterium]
MKSRLLQLLLALVTLFTAGNFLVSLHALRAQEAAMDSMMRSYVLDLAENFSSTMPEAGSADRPHRPRMARIMRFRMLSVDPALQTPEAGGMLLISSEGRVLSSTPGAERLLPLWKGVKADEEPLKIEDADGNSFYVVVRSLEGDSFIMAAVSRTHLLAPLAVVWRNWVLSAMLTSAAVLLGVFMLWRLLAFPLRGFVERLGLIKWGKEPDVNLYDGPLAELSALSAVIGRLAAESYEKEELKARYVTDLVEAQENTRRQLARELHDGALQSAVAAIKRIQLARRTADDPALEHLDTAEEAAQATATEIRDYCEALSPSWARLGLTGALEETAARLARAYEGLEIDVDADMELLRTRADFDEAQVTALARILHEAASNSVRHGGARFIQVELRIGDGRLLFSIQDDGSGFDAEGLTGDGFEELRAAGKRGLSNIFERSRLLRAEMTIASRPGEGCRLEILLPLEADGAPP